MIPGSDVVSTLSASTDFRTWITILVRTLLIDDLRGPGSWLVLAPTDEAFRKLPNGELDALFKSSAIERLVDLAEHHIVFSPLCSLDGHLALGRTSFTGARYKGNVVRRITCSNGEIAVLDRVVIPRGAATHALRSPFARADPRTG